MAVPSLYEVAMGISDVRKEITHVHMNHLYTDLNCPVALTQKKKTPINITLRLQEVA